MERLTDAPNPAMIGNPRGRNGLGIRLCGGDWQPQRVILLPGKLAAHATGPYTTVGRRLRCK
jgi:hypothetical protein